MHERRTIDPRHQMSSIQWQPKVLAIKFGALQGLSTGLIDYN